MTRFEKPNEEFWRTLREGQPTGRFEFYDDRSQARGIGVVMNGHITSVTLKEGPAGWTFKGWGSITHWRPDGRGIFPKASDLQVR